MPISSGNVSSVAKQSSAGCCSLSGDSAAERRRMLKELSDEFRDIVGRARASVAELGNSTTKRGRDPRIKSGTVIVKETETFELEAQSRLPLVAELSHRVVNNMHLWIAVRQPGVVVLDDEDHRIMLALVRGESPKEVVQQEGIVRACSPNIAEGNVSRLIGRLAGAGFIYGIRGYVEAKTNSARRFARFHLTKACNLECIHCYADSSPHVDRSNELDTGAWLRIVEEFAKNGGERILLTGGEALVHRGCKEIMMAAKQSGLHVTLFTNGVLVPRHIDIIRETADQVQVSLDGPDARTNDAVRGKDTFEKILRAVDILLDNNVRTRLGMTVMGATWKSFKNEFRSFAYRYANRPLEFGISFGTMQYGRGESIPNDLDLSETQTLAEQFMSLGDGGDRGARITRMAKGCGYGEQLVIGPDGTVYPCHLLDAPICHVNEMSVPSVIDLVQSMTKLVDVDHVTGCNTCDIRYLCGGTCRVMDSRTTGSRFVTTCTPVDKQRRLGKLVEFYRRDTLEGARATGGVSFNFQAPSN